MQRCIINLFSRFCCNSLTVCMWLLFKIMIHHQSIHCSIQNRRTYCCIFLGNEKVAREGREAFFLDTKMMNSSMLPDFKYWLLYLLLIRNNYLLGKAELQCASVEISHFTCRLRVCQEYTQWHCTSQYLLRYIPWASLETCECETSSFLITVFLCHRTLLNISFIIYLVKFWLINKKIQHLHAFGFLLQPFNIYFTSELVFPATRFSVFLLMATMKLQKKRKKKKHSLSDSTSALDLTAVQFIISHMINSHSALHIISLQFVFISALHFFEVSILFAFRSHVYSDCFRV